jgi:hypothetical protein
MWYETFISEPYSLMRYVKQVPLNVKTDAKDHSMQRIRDIAESATPHVCTKLCQNQRRVQMMNVFCTELH